MYCRFCGKLIEDDSRVCCYCGKELQAQPRRKLQPAVLIAAAAALVLLIVLVVVLTRPSKQPAAQPEQTEEASAVLTADQLQIRIEQELSQQLATDDAFDAAVRDQIHVQVDDLQETETGYEATCTVGRVDVETALQDYLDTMDPAAAVTEEEALNAVQTQLPDAPQTEQSFTVTVEEEDGSYTVVLSGELVDFCEGDYVEPLQIFVEQIQSLSEPIEVRWERFYVDENWTNYLVVEGVDEDGGVVWSYQTPNCVSTELETTQLVCVENGLVYLIAQAVDDESAPHGLIALNQRTGEVVWYNTDFFGASVHYVMDDVGTIYLCGYYGPDCMAIDANGNTLWGISQVDENLFWPGEMFWDNGNIAIRMYGMLDGYDENGALIWVTPQGEVVQQEASQPEPQQTDAGTTYQQFYNLNYSEQNAIGVIADVTGDGVAELIVVVRDGSGGMTGSVFTPENGDFRLLEFKEGAEFHAGGFFSWYLKPTDNGYLLVEEGFGMWQGMGIVNMTAYRLDQNGNREIVHEIILNSEDEGCHDEYGTVTDEAYGQFVDAVTVYLQDAYVIDCSQTHNCSEPNNPLDTMILN